MEGGREKANDEKKKREYSTFYSNIRIVSFKRGETKKKSRRKERKTENKKESI